MRRGWHQTLGDKFRARARVCERVASRQAKSGLRRLAYTEAAECWRRGYMRTAWDWEQAARGMAARAT